jgi:[ribosomal protein S5]-alanine N-acetyltransferase
MEEQQVILRGKKISIRPPRLSDAQSVYYHINDKSVVRWTVHIPHPYPRYASLKYIKSCMKTWDAGTQYLFVIVRNDTDKAIGMVDIMHVDAKHRHAELGYWLGRAYWGRGVMTEAVRLGLSYAFGTLRLHRVYGKCFAENRGSGRVMEKCGMKKEGCERQDQFRYNRWHDIYTFGILAEEWAKR